MDIRGKSEHSAQYEQAGFKRITKIYLPITNCSKMLDRHKMFLPELNKSTTDQNHNSKVLNCINVYSINCQTDLTEHQ